MTSHWSPSVGSLPRQLPRQRRAELLRTHSEMQAIRDGSGATIGYELFYRDSEAADRASERTTAATLNVLAGLTTSRQGTAHPSGSHYYFVNVTREVVVGDVELPDPSRVAVLEVQPEVLADEAVRAGAQRLRARGYGLALDRFVPGQPNGHDRLLPLASHVKLDVDGGDPESLRAAARHVREASNALLIGCRIGSRPGHDLAKEIGCDLFQGFVLDDGDRRMQQSVRGSLTAYVRLLELLIPDDLAVDLDRLVDAVMRDGDLSLRVLHACNVVSAGSVRRINSVRDAVVRLGVGQLRRMVHVSIAQGLAVQGDDQLLSMVEYATLAELIGLELDVSAGTGFLAGLLLETADVLQISLGEIIGDLPLDEDLAASMRHRTGAVGSTLDVLDAYKRGDIAAVEVRIGDIATLHTRAMLMTAGLLQLTGGLDHSQAPVPDLPPIRPLQLAAPDDLPPGFGPPPTADEEARADQWHRWAQERSFRTFLRGSLRLEDLEEAEQARWSRMIERRALSSAEIDDVVHVPMWQFGTDGQVLPGVEALVRDFPGDAVALTEWITQPCPGLGRANPLALILQAQVDLVVRHVQGLGSW